MITLKDMREVKRRCEVLTGKPVEVLLKKRMGQRQYEFIIRKRDFVFSSAMNATQVENLNGQLFISYICARFVQKLKNIERRERELYKREKR